MTNTQQLRMDVPNTKEIHTVEDYQFEPIKGYPMLHWQGKRPFNSTQYYPAQRKEVHGEEINGWLNKIFWGDNLQVMSHLLKEYRGKVALCYLDPPFDSKADYRKKIHLKGKNIKNELTTFEEKQYSDMWINDEYLQFIYERLILIREFLCENGSLWIHCDWHRNHHLRCILSEIFGENNFMNEVVWQRTDPHNDAKSRLGFIHDNILWYAKNRSKAIYNWKNVTVPISKSAENEYSLIKLDNGEIVSFSSDLENKGRRIKLENCTYKGNNPDRQFEWRGAKPSPNRVWSYKNPQEMDKALEKGELYLRNPNRGSTRCKVYYLDENEGKVLQTIWTDCGRMKGGVDYPTRKPELLIERIVKASSNPGDLVFDCFMGSGTTQAVAMKLGRKFIGADINLGAVQITTKRLLGIAQELNEQQQQGQLEVESEEPTTYYTGFEVYNVNHYDIFRNPIQAKELLIEALEINPIERNSLYDGEKDGRMVKIMPVNRIATRADLNELINGFDYKTFKKIQNEHPSKAVEKITLVCMGHEPDLAAQLQKEVKPFHIDVEVVDILRDKSNLEFKRDSEAVIDVKKNYLVIEKFYPMNLLQKLSIQQENVEDWREMVESIMIDWNYDGAVLEPHTVDIPGKNELVEGKYKIPEDAGTIDEAGVTLNTMDHSRFNVIISNTQKIILKKNTKEKSALDKLLESGKPDYQPNSVYDLNADLYGFDEPDDEVSLSTNQRFEKLRRIEQLGIYIDEAHHVFGTKLANTIGIKTTKTSLRLTVDELANSLRKAGTQVVACYNYTGTPYVGKEVLPEVVYAYGLRQAIDNKYLKKVRINGYSNTRTNEFVEIAIADFLKHNSNQRHEGMLPKMAFFAANIDELQKELRPAVEKALEKHGIPSSSILVNVGYTKLTTNDDIREFNRLDTPESEKQFILLVNKGREGWNCRSLFSVALFRQPRSKIFVLQATMRCLRAIGTAQPTGHVYLSEDNKSILEKELDQNFRISISDLEKIGKEKEVIEINPVPPPVTITLKRVRKKYNLVEKKIATGINLELDKVETDKYKIIHTEQEGLTVKDAGRHRVKQEDLTDLREKREFSEITLVAEISRYLNKSCLFIENILATTQEGTDNILDKVNEFNEVLYDWVIPRLFKEFYDIDEQEDAIDEYPVQLVKLSKEGFRFSASEDMIARQQEAGELVTKSFHLDTYCFDSKPEKTLFWDLLKEGKIKKIYFTGMLTHGQSDFYIQYIDPDSHTVRSYYPDFLFQKNDDSYVIVEVKADGLIDEPVVQAKKQYAEQWAGQNEMTYKIIASSDAEKGHYASLL